MFRSDPLPADFPQIQTLLSDPERMEPGVTFFNLIRPGNGLLAAVDERVEVVWYYRQSIPGILDSRRLKNGHLLFLDQQGAGEVDMLGNTIQRWHPANLDRSKTDFLALSLDSAHHEIFDMPSGNFLTLSSESRTLPDYPTSETDPKAPTAPSHVIGDIVGEFRRDGTIERQWSLFDILDPYRIGFDSLRGNWDDTHRDNIDAVVWRE